MPPIYGVPISRTIRTISPSTVIDLSSRKPDFSQFAGAHRRSRSGWFTRGSGKNFQPTHSQPPTLSTTNNLRSRRTLRERTHKSFTFSTWRTEVIETPYYQNDCNQSWTRRKVGTRLGKAWRPLIGLKQFADRLKVRLVDPAPTEKRAHRVCRVYSTTLKVHVRD
jgi:hypothetical protein